jgi:hypothetical protein
MSQHSDSRDVFFCDCGYTEHMFIVDHQFWGDGMDPEFYIMPMLSPKPLLKRLGIALQYLLGRQSRHGAFDSILLDREDVCRLRDNCNRFLETHP